MRLLDLVHRWTGALVGLILAILGLSGALLVHRDALVFLPHVDDAQVQESGAIITAVEKMMADPAHRPRSILFAKQDFGLNLLTYEDRSGAYTDQGGAVVASWQSLWERPELFLFDLHHHLLAGEAGEVVTGIVGGCALFFIFSGLILWWRTRKTFKFRLWPARMSRPAIVRQHRDLGVVIAPLLLLTVFTGVSMIFPPLASVVLGPGTASTLATAAKPPESPPAPLADAPDWRGMITTARARFPDGEIRMIALPREEGGPIMMRMKQPAEWLPNGRTSLWFTPDTGRLIEARDALALPREARGFNLFYPLHAAKVGGLAYRLVMTLVGLALTLLGTLTVWSFWFRRPPAPRKGGRAAAVPAE